MDTVGADQNIALRRRAVGQRQGYAAAVLIDALDARSKPDPFLAQPTQQDIEQLCTVRRVVW